MKTLLRRLLFRNLMATLSVLLSLVQVLIAHWLIVVLAKREWPEPATLLPLTGLIVAANLLAMRGLRRFRRQPGWPRRAARLYMSGGLATLLVGMALGLAWVTLYPISSAFDAIWLTEGEAFEFFRAASAILVCGLGGMVVWGFTGGQAWVEHSRVRIEVKGLDSSQRGLRLIQISDLHIGNGLENDRLTARIREVNAMEPDLVAVTGDLFDFDPIFVEEGARRLAELKARLGVFGVLGNHDRYTGSEQIASALGSHAPQLRLLRGEIVRLPLDAPLYVAGVDDPEQDWTARGVHLEQLEQLGARLPKDGPVLLLVHRPEAFPQAARLGFPLVLAGHTHGGQLALPTPGGRFNLARIISPLNRGLYRMGGSTLYVNRGLGVAGPAIRFNCPREITTIELA